MVEYDRPSEINAYGKQQAFIDCNSRYVIVEATTKAGKSVGMLVWLFEEALRGGEGCNYWWVAPVNSQAKVMFRRLKRFIDNQGFFESNESELFLRLANGSTIWFKSADKPDSLYGDDVQAAVLDEFTRMKEDAWIAVRSTVTATKGKVRFIGNVKGVNNWGYHLARQAEQGREGWSYFKLTAQDAIDAGVLSDDEIEDARSVLPHEVFLELYFAIPNTSKSNKFCFSFNKTRHVGQTNELPGYYYLSFDFNYNPICCSIFQYNQHIIQCIETIKLPNSNIYNLCDVILTKYPNKPFIINGDYSGVARLGIVQDNLNYYKIIREKLGVSETAIQIVPNPNLADNQVLVNGILEHKTVIFDENKAQSLIFDCENVEMSNENKIIKTDRNDPTQQADALDTFRYFLNKNFSQWQNRVLKAA